MGEQPDNVSEGANEETTSPAAISVDTMERLKTCPGFVEVDPRLLQVFADSITMNNDVGYFLKDIACQTEESSITDLNDMIKIIQVTTNFIKLFVLIIYIYTGGGGGGCQKSVFIRWILYTIAVFCI